MATGVDATEGRRSPTPPPAPTRLLSLLFLGNLAMYPIFFGVAQVLLPVQLERIDAAGKVADLGLVAGTAAAVGALAQPIAGAVSDRIGRRSPFLIAGAAAAALLLWLLSRSTNVAAVLLWWVLVTAAMNVYQAAMVAIVPDRVAQERLGTASSVVALTVPLGLILGLAVAAGTAENGGTGHLLLGGLLLITALVVVVGLREATSSTATGSTLDLRPPGRRRRWTFLSSLRHRDFRSALIARFLMFVGFLFVDNLMLYLLQDYVAVPAGWTPAQGVLTLSLVSAGGLLVTATVCGWLSDRIGRRKPFVVVGLAVYAASVVPVLVDPTWTALLIFSLVGGLGFGGYYALDTAIATLVLPSADDHARDMGIFNLGYVGSTVVGPVLGSTLVTVTGGYAALFVAGVVVAAAGTVMVLRIRSIR